MNMTCMRQLPVNPHPTFYPTHRPKMQIGPHKTITQIYLGKLLFIAVTVLVAPYIIFIYNLCVALIYVITKMCTYTGLKSQYHNGVSFHGVSYCMWSTVVRKFR